MMKPEIKPYGHQSRNDLLIFFLLTFIIAWLLWLAGIVIFRAIISNSSALAPANGLVFLFGTLSPALVAIILTKRSVGNRGLNSFFKHLFQFRVNTRLYLFAFLFIAVIKLLAALIYRIAIGVWPQFGNESWFTMIFATFISMWVQAGEEIGWRGYSLPRLTEKFGLAVSSIILGIIWAVWHLPLFFIEGLDTYRQSFPMYLLQVVGISVTMAWLFWKSKGSILPVMLFHAAVNNIKDIVPSAAKNPTNVFSLEGTVIGWLTVTLIWISAVYFLITMRKATLHQNYS